MSEYIFAVDPGNEQSAYTIVEANTLRPVAVAIVPNTALGAYLVDALEKQYLADEIMDEFDKAMAIVKQKEKRRRQDARRKRTKRGQTKVAPRE